MRDDTVASVGVVFFRFRVPVFARVPRAVICKATRVCYKLLFSYDALNAINITVYYYYYYNLSNIATISY